MNIDIELPKGFPKKNTVLAVGVFDGVHIGHRHLITRLSVEANRNGYLAGVVTFKNHPASVLRPDFKPLYLTAINERMRLLKSLGPSFVIPIKFDKKLSKLSARQFIGLLKERLRMRGLVIGPDFAMGHQREGNAKVLSILGQDMGFFLRVVTPFADKNGQSVSSTTIRKSLIAGEVKRVELQMGRSFALTGKVVKGAGRGKSLGFPTANIEPSQELAIPGDGIYATWANISGQRYMAATSIGKRPTFGQNGHTIEAFILDYDRNLYNKHIRLEFVCRLREERKFNSVDALKEQMKTDVTRTRILLENSVGINKD